MVVLKSSPFTTALIHLQTSLRAQITANFRLHHVAVRDRIATLRNNVCRRTQIVPINQHPRSIRVDPSDITWILNGQTEDHMWCVGCFNVKNRANDESYLDIIHALDGRHHTTKKGVEQIVFEFECNPKLYWIGYPAAPAPPAPPLALQAVPPAPPLALQAVPPLPIRSAATPIQTWGDENIPDSLLKIRRA